MWWSIFQYALATFMLCYGTADLVSRLVDALERRRRR